VIEVVALALLLRSAPRDVSPHVSVQPKGDEKFAVPDEVFLRVVAPVSRAPPGSMRTAVGVGGGGGAVTVRVSPVDCWTTSVTDVESVLDAPHQVAPRPSVVVVTRVSAIDGILSALVAFVNVPVAVPI
jgi:hypothetical protein